MTEKALVVDLCGTIVRENTTHGFLLYHEYPLIRRLWARFVLSRVISFAISRISPGAQRRLLIRSLYGLPLARLHEMAMNYAETSLRKNARETVLTKIREQKICKGRVLLASASLDFIVEAFAAQLESDGFVATELCYDANGVCQGKINRDSTGCKLSRLHEANLGKPFQFDAISDNPEDVDLKNAANEFWFVEDHVS